MFSALASDADQQPGGEHQRDADQQAGDGARVQRTLLAVAQRRCQLDDHLEDRAGTDAEQERGERCR